MGRPQPQPGTEGLQGWGPWGTECRLRERRAEGDVGTWRTWGTSHLLLALSVQGAAVLVEDEDAGVPQQRTGNGHRLPLPPGELSSQLAHLCGDRGSGWKGTLQGARNGAGTPYLCHSLGAGG